MPSATSHRTLQLDASTFIFRFGCGSPIGGFFSGGVSGGSGGSFTGGSLRRGGLIGDFFGSFGGSFLSVLDKSNHFLAAQGLNRSSLSMRLFLTGTPGVGKTTVIRAVLQRLKGVDCAGFYSEEERHGGQRTGFKIVTLDGPEGPLASVGRKEPTVGRYSVHIAEFEKLVLPRLDPDATEADFYVIDEIGKMELLSHKFRARIVDLLARPSNLLATIAKKGKGFVDQIKRRNDIELVEVTRKNRDELPREIVEKIKSVI